VRRADSSSNSSSRGQGEQNRVYRQGHDHQTCSTSGRKCSTGLAAAV
jgi:hypothetical protein